ncbi:MAG: hypothetical protein QGF74_02765 [Candidatus Nanoarchaeia archaeon]|jgi:hypothetical protein|nr:hypothetical protein [Candidatus Nanoarchaeia archaeon]|tara:strand:- start:5462 stop:6073 length:612 start_codon:yes stop_codon:yes gene_type:complete
MKSSIIRKEKIPFYKNKKILTGSIGLFIIGTMVFSIFGYSSTQHSRSGDSNYYDYDGYRFVATNQGWLTHLGENPISFYFGPRELEYFNPEIDFKINNLDYLDKIYVSLHPNENLHPAAQEFTRFINFGNNYVIACSEDGQGCEDIPIKTCEDATNTIGVIEFNFSNETKIITDNTCVKVEGSQQSIIMLTNKIVLTELGIMK